MSIAAIILAAVLAIFAGNAAEPAYPPEWWAGLATGDTIVNADFVGREWDCGDERCYAGFAIDTGTGPGLTTGPRRRRKP